MLTDYNINVQRLFLEMMLEDATAFVRVQNIFNAENFDRELRSAAQFIYDHSEQHGTLPDRVQILATTGVELAAIPDLNAGHYDWFFEEFESFTRRTELERAILKSADLLEQGEYEPVEKLIKDAVQISLTKDLGMDFWSDPAGMITRYYDNGGQVSTGWPQMDRLLYGGFSHGELNIFAGGSGCVTHDTEIQVMELPDTQPKTVPIGSLMGKTEKSTYLVSSPDGWVPVTDCIEKIKSHMYVFTFASGRTIHASDDHLYQRPDLSWGYARSFRVGDHILSQADTTDAITGIVSYVKPTKVYDLSVNHDNHRYYTNGVCSHNSGKSLVMMNIALNWLQAGLHGVYITLELSEELTGLRTAAMLTDMSTKEIRKDQETAALKIKMQGKKAGSYQVKSLPAQSNVNDIRAFIKEYQVKTGRRVDFIMIDYLDLLTPASVKVGPSDLFVKDKHVSEELRNLARELNLLMVTASQLNRCLALNTKVIANGQVIEIQDVQVGDFIESDQGPVQVTEKLPVTRQPVYEIRTRSGKSVVCSAQHKFPTDQGLMTVLSGLAPGHALRTQHEEHDVIQSMNYLGYQDTIDINTTGNRLFYANGILTHNSAVDEIEFDHSHISGGISKINTADNVFGIFTSRAMRERGQYQIQCMKSRSSQGVGQKINLEYNVDTMRITDPGESQETHARASQANIYNAIRTPSKLTAMSTGTDHADPVPLEPDEQTAKLKSLLSKIKPVAK